MSLYPKIDDLSILIDNDCKRMLRRTSRKLIIDEVLNKLFNDKEDNKKKEQHTRLYEIILNIFGCNLKK